VFYVLAGVLTLMDPTRNVDFFWQTFVQSPVVFLIGHGAIVLGAVVALAVIPAVAQLLQGADNGWVQWASRVAYLGFSALALATIQDMTTDVMYFTVDPYRWLSTLCIGFWLLAVNVLALRTGAWPRLLASLGVIAACTYGFALAGNIPGSPVAFVVVAEVSAFALRPIWFVWIGLRLR